MSALDLDAVLRLARLRVLPPEVDDAAAGELLRRLVAERPGALRIITAERVSPASHEYALRDPRAFVCHAVTSVEQSATQPARPGRVVVRSAEGDLQIGRPRALLLRLVEAAHACAGGG